MMPRRPSQEPGWVHTKSVAATGTRHSLLLWQQPVESPGDLITTQRHGERGVLTPQARTALKASVAAAALV